MYHFSICKPKRTTELPDYDIAILGAGAAGGEIAYAAIRGGLKVAMIEQDRLGGLCLKYGCDPAKSLAESARAVYDARHASELGINVDEVSVDMPAVVASMDRVLDRMSGGGDIVARLRATGIDYYEERGRFVEPLAIAVNGQTIRAKDVVIATGTRAAAPDIEGLADTGYITNVEAVRLQTLPPRLAVVGAGPVGLEFAQIFRRFGSEVLLVESQDRICSQEEPEVSDLVAGVLRREGIEILENARIQSVERGASGGELLRLGPPAVSPRHMLDMPLWDQERRMIADGLAAGANRVIEIDEILVAAGRTPNIDGIGLDVPEVATSQAGIIVDDRLRTSAPNVWAAGDVTDDHRFAHVAGYQAEVLIANLIEGRDRVASYDSVPWCIFTDPAIAHVGMTEREARGAGHAVATTVYSLSDLPRALIRRRTDGLIKLVATRSGQILGAHVVADEAGSIAAMYVLAIRAGLTIHQIADAVLPYPTMAEAGRWAALQMIEQLRSEPAPNTR